MNMTAATPREYTLVKEQRKYIIRPMVSLFNDKWLPYIDVQIAGKEFSQPVLIHNPADLDFGFSTELEAVNYAKNILNTKFG